MNQDTIRTVLLEGLFDESIGLREVVDHSLRGIVLDVSQDHVHDSLVFEFWARMRRYSQDMSDAAA